jgi:regulator of RNase E activity RraA
VPVDIVQGFRAVPTANVSDAMTRMAGSPRLRPMHAGGVLAGPALTIKTPPGDNLMVYKALDMVEHGDVLVIDAGGDVAQAIVGELMIARARMHGIVGMVINGAIRDRTAVGAGHFPVYAAGVTCRGPWKNGPGEINVPIAIDGMVIEPGDLILGDEDGIVCVPHRNAEEVLTAALAKQAAEKKQMQDIAAGRNEQPWVDMVLQRLGCMIEP